MAKKYILLPALYQINDIILVYIFQICYCSWMKHIKHQIFPHFSVEVLKQRYLECECPCERTHWHIIPILRNKVPLEDLLGFVNARGA